MLKSNKYSQLGKMITMEVYLVILEIVITPAAAQEDYTDRYWLHHAIFLENFSFFYSALSLDF